MRRILFVSAFVFGLGLAVGSHATVGVAQETVGPVPITIHNSTCAINYPTLGLGGVYESCHHNVLEAGVFTYDSLESEPIEFVTDVDGVGVALILNGVHEETGATLTASLESRTELGAYAYCKDQIGGLVLFDGHVPDETGTVELGTITADMEIVCDWYNYLPPIVAVG